MRSEQPLEGRLRAGQWVALLVGAMAVVLLVAGGLALSASQRLTDARELVLDQVDPALNEASRLEDAVLNQETGVRGYLLGRSEGFLDPYTTGEENERDALARLTDLARQDRRGGAPALLQAVADASVRWRREYAAPAIDATRDGRDPVEAELGKARFDALRARVDRLQADLAARRRVATDRLDDAAGALTRAIVLGGLALALSLVLVLLAIRRLVTVPLGRLASDARAVAGGDFERHVSPAGARDLREVAVDVDEMRDRILAELRTAREANRRLDEQTAELQRSNSELEQFAYVASHDLQEPLRKVASFTQMLQKRYAGQLDERADQYIAFAVDGAHRMQQLINDLLAFSRVGRDTREAQDVDLQAVARAVLGDLQPAIEEAGATVRADGLPTVRGDRTLLGAVVQNLVTNALKFRREGVAPEVELTARREGDTWEIAIADNGIGIDADYADRIFVIFQRLHGRSAYEGTGIGLAMCRKIVEHQGGRIWLDTDRPPPGTTFRFTLPAVAAQVQLTEETA